jgi:hypothetical protein
MTPTAAIATRATGICRRRDRPTKPAPSEIGTVPVIGMIPSDEAASDELP